MDFQRRPGLASPILVPMRIASPHLAQSEAQVPPDLARRLPSESSANLIAAVGIASGFGYVLLTALGIIK